MLLPGIFGSGTAQQAGHILVRTAWGNKAWDKKAGNLMAISCNM
jgi:hypothetical protein